ncbi:MAG TPA: cytochrome b5-like heme/steroid binding domain-containing protein [Gallionellaceae bacterium]|jgi:cytochrome b involved in lipid metabolism|nr:cytochrome b5-like heme/steroid binding domain-containing protein [Gallionellaceae bacterium]HQS73869.1 cytochrome b5-like heme/steroid binding domain-containing protein [Gallionellaceae bacterium]
MRTLFILSTIIFWLAAGGVWLADYLRATPPEQTAPAAIAAPREYSLADVATHNHQHDCWMAIEGQVYDLTGYVPAHPAAPEIILAWCGKEASQAWQTKTRGRPHSPYAQNLLPQYRTGKLRQTP